MSENEQESAPSADQVESSPEVESPGILQRAAEAVGLGSDPAEPEVATSEIATTSEEKPEVKPSYKSCAKENAARKNARKAG